MNQSITNSLRAIIAKREETERQIKALQDECNEFVHSRRRIIIEVGRHLPDDDRLWLAKQLYWELTEAVRVQDIYELVGTARGSKSLLKIIGPLELLAVCSCGNQTIEEFPNRTKLKNNIKNVAFDNDGNPYYAGYVECDECKQRRYASYKQQESYTDIINKLRSMPYSEYLKTDHWQDLRKRMLKRAGYRCQLCNAEGQLHVHHRTYKNRGNEPYGDLIVLCADCHEAFHENRNLSS